MGHQSNALALLQTSFVTVCYYGSFLFVSDNTESLALRLALFLLLLQSNLMFMLLLWNKFTAWFSRGIRSVHPFGMGGAMVALATLCAEPNHASEVTINPLLAEGYAQLEAGHLNQALIIFEQAVQADAGDLSARLGQAMIYAGQERYQHAFIAYDSIVQDYPNYFPAWHGRGLAAFNSQDFDTALTSFQMATIDQPVNGYFYESLGWAYMCRGDFAAAAASARQASLMYDRQGEPSVYPLLIAYFSYHESGDVANALRTLKYANRNKHLNQWPAPVIDYISETIDQSNLISCVTNRIQETEAHTYIGLYLRLLGRHDAASQHFNWVSRHGDPKVFEYMLARALHLQTGLAAVKP